MKPTSATICSQIVALDERGRALRNKADALSLDAVSGDKNAMEELASIRAEIAGLVTDREVLAAAYAHAAKLEAFARDDADDAERLEHLAAARSHAVATLKAAQDVDKAIAAFIAASTALEAAESVTRQHVRLAGENPNGRVGREGASAHGMLLLARIADGTARRRNDRTVSETVSVAWRELLEEETADA